MKVTKLMELLSKFEIENPEVIAQSSQDSEKATDIDSIQYYPEIKLLYLVGEDL